MNALVLLLTGSMLAAPPGGARPFPLRLERGQEFIFHASYTQEGDRADANLSRFLDTYVLILEPVFPAKAAFMTVQRVPALPGAEPIPIVRLEFGQIDAFGRVILDSTSNLPCLPIDGPPTLETVPFMEMPRELPPPGKPWQVPDSDWGSRTWRVLMEEKHELGRCMKLKCEQSSGDWNLAGRLVWKREEFVSLLQYEGLIVRVERMTEWRTAGGEKLRSTAVVALDSVPASLPPGQFADRRAEVQDYVRFSRVLFELMKPRGEPDRKGYEELLTRIDHHSGRGTPYEIAFQSLRRRVESARIGERPPDPIVIPVKHDSLPPPQLGAVADVNQFAPDVFLRDSRTDQSTSLSSLRGEPVVMLFTHASGETTDRIVRYARQAAKVYADRVHIVLMAVDGEAAELQKLRTTYHLSQAIYDGRDIVSQFAGSAMPRIVVVDPKGMIRMIATGWHDKDSQESIWHEIATGWHDKDSQESIWRELVKIVQEK